MSKFALVSPSDQILEFRFYDVLPVVSTNPQKPRLLPVALTDVTFDPATEVRLGPVYVVQPTQVTETYTKRAKTAGELDADKDLALGTIFDPVNVALLKALFNINNRVRTLEGQATLTAPQFRAAIKSLL